MNQNRGRSATGPNDSIGGISMFFRPVRRRRVCHRAFTLIELCVGLAVGTIICIGMLTLWKGGARLFRKQNTNLEALQTALLASEIIREDLSNAVLSGRSVRQQNGTTMVPDFTPFVFQAPGTSTAGSGGGSDVTKPPVGLPDPIDLTKGDTFTFFRTIRDDSGSAPSLPPVFEQFAGNGPAGQQYTPDGDSRFKLVAVTYSLRERHWKKWKYWYFNRLVRDGTGKVVEKREYRNIRLRNFLIVFHERDIENIGGQTNFTPPPPQNWMQFVQQFVNALTNLFNFFGGSGGGGGNQQKPPRDYVYYIQFMVTGLSSQPDRKDFVDFQENTLMGVVSFDALSEKIRRENAALYWNSHAADDGYLTTGEFDFLDGNGGNSGG